MKANAAMTRLLASHPGAAEILVPSPFRLLVLAGFKAVDGCVFFRELFPHNDLGGLDLHPDRTGYEASVNKIHLEDFLEKGMAREAPSLALTAVPCAEYLADRLRAFSPDPFRILVSVSGGNSTLRFHKIRASESWIEDNIDSYDEGIFVVDTATE